jgi:hypothetical protein
VGRIIKWLVELGEFDLEFCPQQAIKSQILADFVFEWMETQQPPSAEKPEHWKMYFDGSLNLEGAGAGVLFISPQGDHLKYVLQIHYKASNNDVEYEALIHGCASLFPSESSDSLPTATPRSSLTKSTRSATSRKTR